MKIAFVYAGGREARWEAARAGEGPSEFFYGAVELARAGHEVGIHDAVAETDSRVSAGLNLALGWAAPVRLRGGDVVAVGRLLWELNRYDVVVGAATATAMALGVWERLGALRRRVVGIHCGMVNHPLAGARLAASRWALANQRCVLFAESEREEMDRRFGVESVVNTFGVDVGFWGELGEERVGETGGYVLAVGNDARRDYGTLVEAVRGLDSPVKILTNRELPRDLPGNVEHLRGSWRRPAVTDAELRELYRGARVVVVPLEDAVQPAGQSVALQAMAGGKTVVMTRTRGLWTGDDFLEGEHLRLVPVGDKVALRAAVGAPVLDAAVVRRRVRERGTMAAFAERLVEVLGS